MNEGNGSTRFSRRQFLIALEGVLGLTIAGVIIAPKVADSVAAARGASPRPALLDCLELRPGPEGVDVYDLSAPGAPTLVCSVNSVGGQILPELNGAHTLDGIVEATLQKLGRQRADPQAFGGKVALFIAELAQAGFLKQPFYVEVIEERFAA